MSDILALHAGKLGDVLWSLCTLKALSGKLGSPVDLMVSTYLRPLIPLLKAQSYIDKALVNEDWNVRFECPVEPRVPPNDSSLSTTWDKVYNLSYEGWPEPTLVEDPARRMGIAIDPWKPWLRALGDSGTKSNKIGLCFSSDWFELKAGLVLALLKHFPSEQFCIFTFPGDRFAEEVVYPFKNVHVVYTGVSGLSDWLIGCKLVIACRSMARVMAFGLGVPTVVCEPSPPRCQKVFDPPGQNPRERITTSFDARELCQNVEEALKCI